MAPPTPRQRVRQSERSLIKGLFPKMRPSVNVTTVTSDESYLRTGGSAGSQLYDRSTQRFFGQIRDQGTFVLGLQRLNLEYKIEPQLFCVPCLRGTHCPPVTRAPPLLTHQLARASGPASSAPGHGPSEGCWCVLKFQNPAQPPLKWPRYHSPPTIPGALPHA